MSAVPPSVIEQNSGAPASIAQQPYDQYLRQLRLIVFNDQNALDLSALRVQFRTSQWDTATPNLLEARVWNLSPQTVKSVLKEYTKVTLEAGYQNGRFAIVFSGDIKQFRRGRENAIDSFLDIFAADMDPYHQYGIFNYNLPKGTSVVDQWKKQNEEAQKYGVQPGQQQLGQGTGGILPRGKVVSGQAIWAHRQTARNLDATWSIQNGKLTLAQKKGYLPGDIIKINAQSGMIGQPEATDQGIVVTVLLNPSIQIGQRIQINNADINQTLWPGETSSGTPSGLAARGITGWPNIGEFTYYADVTDDGVYRVLVVEHRGDTRGNDYYSDLVCLALDTTATSAATGQTGVPTDTQPSNGDQDFSGGSIPGADQPIPPVPPEKPTPPPPAGGSGGNGATVPV